MFRKSISALLLTALLLSMAACGGNSPADTDAPDNSGDSTPSDTTADAGYEFAELDLKEETYTILSPDGSVWSLNDSLDFEAMTGETLDDAIYNRNRNLEEKYNFKFEVTLVEMYQAANTLRTAVAANEDTYDFAYPEGNRMNALLTEGAVLNLFDVPTLNLDQPWWNQISLKEAILGDDILYFAQSNLNLSAFDLANCLFFNEDMMADLKLDMPYDLVREGKWTLDALRTYTKAAANLNGDDNFVKADDGRADDLSGKATYGLTTIYNGALAMMIGAGIEFASKDADGTPAFTMENERFYSIIEKIVSLTSSAGEYLGTKRGSPVSEPNSSLGMFSAGRALFIASEVKASGEFRDMTATFGMVPFPKYDEDQDTYRAWTSYLSPVVVIPVTAKNAEASGAILDALSYMSYKDVLPIYYDLTLSQKGLRNDDSIDMLDIIRESLIFDASLAYGWTNTLAETLRDRVQAGDGNVSSIVAQHKTAIETSISQMMEDLVG